MDYRRLGRTGLKVSEICLGTMTFGHGADQAETDRIVGTSLDVGVTFFDTADGYNAGQSEIMLGKALGSRRKQTVIASKVFNPTGPGPNDSGMSRSHILDNIESPEAARHRLSRPLLHPSRRHRDAAGRDAARL